MVMVDTVRGPVETADLGTTLMHEHVFVLTPDMLANYPAGWDEEYRVEDAVARLGRLKELGVDTIVDPTVVGLGRYIPRIQRINEAVDINIVAATGLYTYDVLPFRFRFDDPAMRRDGSDPMVDLFVRDLTGGIADTSVRAAFLKCAIDEPGLDPGRRTGDAGRGPGPRSHGCSHHRAHQRAQCRRDHRPAGPGRGRGGPLPGGHRTLR